MPRPATSADVALWRCVVAGGGAVGTMIADLLADAGADVCVVDVTRREPHGGTGRTLLGDITAPDAELANELVKADAIVLAVPADVALAAVDPVAATAVDGALLVDTLSVKTDIVAAVRAGAPALEAISLNPMFAPALGIRGRPVAAIRIADGPRCDALVDLIGAAGGRVVEMSADEHDRVSAATQALTHAAIVSFGIALGELDVDMATVAAVAPPPHASLLALVARICAGAPETYWDVQAANPYAPAARDRLRWGVARLNALVALNDEAGFATVLDDARRTLGTHFHHYRQVCEEMFADLGR